MKTRTQIVAALLFVSFVKTAVAAELPKHYQDDADSQRSSKKVQRIIKTLDALGINDSNLISFIGKVDKRSGDGYVNLSQQEIDTQLTKGTLSFRYVSDGGPSSKRLELHYAPDGSDWRYSVRQDAAKVAYQFKF
jgi:hypothetical protein